MSSSNLKFDDEPKKIMASMRRATLLLLGMANSLELARCRESAESIRSHCANRHREELDKTDRFAFDLAHLRIEQESSHVRRIRGRVELYADRNDDKGEAARIVLSTADFVLDQLEKAHSASCEGRKSAYVCTDALGEITLPDPHAATETSRMAPTVKLSDLDV